jgi:formylglycine-generating enzyme required for sulfatase activity
MVFPDRLLPHISVAPRVTWTGERRSGQRPQPKPAIRGCLPINRLVLNYIAKGGGMKLISWVVLGWLVLLIHNVQGADNALTSDGSPLQSLRDCPDCPEMVVIPSGSFDMGSNNGHSNEKPVHRVTISRAFALGKTEVTQGQWKAIMGNNPSGFNKCGDNCPVEQVSWIDAQSFIKKLSAKTGKQYRLPSEAEWEYACRAGKQQEYCGSDNEDIVAWSNINSNGKTHPVATKQANAWGLYDMSGNVSEWVEDSYHADYNDAPIDGSVWLGEWRPPGGDLSNPRVLRNGSWLYIPQDTRAASRFYLAPKFHLNLDCGFRLARMLP